MSVSFGVAKFKLVYVIDMVVLNIILNTFGLSGLHWLKSIFANIASKQFSFWQLGLL